VCAGVVSNENISLISTGDGSLMEASVFTANLPRAGHGLSQTIIVSIE
jgi:hypothetical protein